MMLSELEAIRYDRQLIIKEWGIKGQHRLKRSTVTVVGVGGLGSPISMYLAAAGVGRLRLVDPGIYELSNLNRQILGWTRDIGVTKVKAAAQKLNMLNPHVEIETIDERVDENNVIKVIDGSDVVVDALDNWKSRYILNEACVKMGIPLIHGGIHGFGGQATTIVPGSGPCLKCIFPRAPEEPDNIPVAGFTPGVIGCIEAMEAVKLIIGAGKPLVGRLLLFDGLECEFTLIKVERDPNCETCSEL